MGESDQGSESKSSFGCPYGGLKSCDKTFKSKNNVRAHIQNAHPDKYDEWMAENYDKSPSQSGARASEIKPVGGKGKSSPPVEAIGDIERQQLGDVLSNVGVSAKEAVLKSFEFSSADDFIDLDRTLSIVTPASNKIAMVLDIWSKFLRKPLPQELRHKYKSYGITGYVVPTAVKSMQNEREETAEQDDFNIRDFLTKRKKERERQAASMLDQVWVARELIDGGFTEDEVEAMGYRVPHKKDKQDQFPIEVNGNTVMVDKQTWVIYQALNGGHKKSDGEERKNRTVTIDGNQVELPMTDSEYVNFVLNHNHGKKKHGNDDDEEYQTYILPDNTKVKMTSDEYAKFIQKYYNDKELSETRDKLEKSQTAMGQVYRENEQIKEQTISTKLQQLEDKNSKQEQELQQFRDDPLKAFSNFEKVAEEHGWTKGRTVEEEAMLKKIQTQGDVTSESIKTATGIAEKRFSQPGGLNSLGNSLAKVIEKTATENPKAVNRIFDRVLGPEQAAPGSPIGGGSDADIEERNRRIQEFNDQSQTMTNQTDQNPQSPQAPGMHGDNPGQRATTMSQNSSPLQCGVCGMEFETPSAKGVHVRQTGHRVE